MLSELFTLLKSEILMLSIDKVKKTKTIWMYNRVFLCQKSYFRVHKSLGEFVSIVALHDVNEGGILYMGISPRRTRLFTHRPEQEQVRAYTLKYIGLFTVPNIWVTHVGSLCWVIPMYFGLFQQQRNQLGSNLNFNGRLV